MVFEWKNSVLGLFNGKEGSSPRLDLQNKLKKGRKSLKKKASRAWDFLFGYEAAFAKLQLKILRDELEESGLTVAGQIQILRREREIEKRRRLLFCFASLPAELLLKIVQKCQAIPYVRLRQSCQDMNTFCEHYHRYLGIYIYRKKPELFMLNSMKQTVPFHRKTEQNGEDIDVPYAVVEYSRLFGEANLKMPLNRETLTKFKQAISGFNFPEVSILNYNDPNDEEGNKEFSEAFDYFMEILADLHVDTLNIKGLTREQYETVIPKLDVDCLRLRKSKINEELMEMGLAKSIRHFSCTFSSPPDYIDFEALLDQKSTAVIELGSWVFDWSSLPYILLEMLEMYQCYISFQENPIFYQVDLTPKVEPILPTNAIHIGPLQPKEIPNAMVNCSTNQEVKLDHWILEIGTNHYIVIAASRALWPFCTGVCLSFSRLYGKKQLNMVFVILLEELLLNGSAIDFSNFYEKLMGAETLEEKKQEMLDYLEYISSLYLE